MNAKEKIKKLIEEGSLTKEDLQELGIQLEEASKEEKEVEQEEPTLEEETDTESEKESEPEVEESKEPEESEPEEVVEEESEPSTEDDSQEVSNDETSIDFANEFNSYKEEQQKALDGLASRIASLEEALTKLSVTIPEDKNNTDFGNPATPSSSKENASSTKLDEIVRRLGGFSR